MNRIEFYNKLSKFREYHELTHSAQDNKYYTKIDKYYSDGRARYFWSKEEWDAYQKEKNAKQAQGAQNAGADRAQKEKDNAQYASNMTKRKAGYKENKAYDQNAQKDKGNAETYNAKTKEINNIYNDIAENTQFKLSPMDEAKLKIYAEAEKKGEEINKKANEYNKQRNIEQNKKYAENAEAEKAAKMKENAQIEVNKSKWNEAVKQKKEKDEYQEKALSYSKKMEEQMRKKEEYSDWKTAQLDKQKEEYKEASDKEIRKQCDDLRAAFDDAYNGNPDSLRKLDNETLDLFLEYSKMSKSDLNDILEPIWDSGFGLKWRQSKEIIDKLKDTVDKMESSMRSNVGQNTTYKDAKKDMTYLKDKKQKIVEKKEKAIDDAVDTEMKNARTSLEKMYNGDTKNFNLDTKLKEKLEEKLEEIDPDYEKGTLYKYVRPYILGKWYRDDDSYENVLQALEELEKELKNKNNRNEAYADFIEDVLNNM